MQVEWYRYGTIESRWVRLNVAFLSAVFFFNHRKCIQ